LRPKEAMLNMLKLLERHPTNRAVLARLEREQVLE